MDPNIKAFLELFGYTLIEPSNYWCCYENNVTKTRFVIRSTFQGAIDSFYKLFKEHEHLLNFNINDVKELLLN